MFNLTILDVAIGMVFVYLLLSLLCSAANEMIELLLKKRAIDLERGIRELLSPGSKSGSDDIVKKLYNHPLVNNLFGGRYEETRIGKWTRYVWRTKLPTYIPSRSFALALMDLILPTGSPPVPAPATPIEPSGTAGSTPPELKPDVVPHVIPGPNTPGNPLANLRNQVATSTFLNATPQARQALLGLIDAAGTDAAKARQNIEDWFNSSMDRVSGWYKRRAQIFIFIIGFFVAVALNADSVTIAKRLATDRSLREAVVSAAQDYAKANATASPTSTPTSTPASTPKQQQGPSDAATAPTNPSPQNAPTSTPDTRPNEQHTTSPTAPPTPAPTPCWELACKDNPDTPQCKAKQRLCKCAAEACEGQPYSPQCKLKQSTCQLDDMGLPIGWRDEEWPGIRFWEEGFVSRWYPAVRLHFFGWLLTALAISLGAPFWFDLLNKFIVIRSTVKPREKSREDQSKD